jgi:hypothetical protein
MTDKCPEVKKLAQKARQYTVKRLREGKVGSIWGEELLKINFSKPCDGGTK